MRVAFASPLPPMSSGIADYAVELLPWLAAAGLDLELFFEGPKPPPAELTSRFPARPVQELPRESSRYDVVVYQLGNSAAHHAAIHRTLLELPGVVALHEFQLHHLIRELTLVAGDGEAYVEEMRYGGGESGRRSARRLLDTHFPVDVWSYPLFERVVDRSLAIAVHSEFARRRVLASRPAAWVERIPFPVDGVALRPPSAEERSAARAELGVADGDFVIGSFGFVTPHKRLEPTLRAFAHFRRELPAARFLVCGEVSLHYDFAGVMRENGADGVEVTGRLPRERFDRAIAAVDLAVNLRHPTGGETSAALMHLLARGVPTAVSNAGSFAEIPDGAVAKIPIGDIEEQLLLALFRRGVAERDLLAAIGRAGRRFVEREHEPAVAAKRWRELLEAVVAKRPTVSPPAPPLAPWRSDDPRVALTAAVGSDCADLGFGDDDGALLAAIAADLAELGWAPNASKHSARPRPPQAHG